jgi:glycolate oxidase FAD binding subunit
MNRVIDYSPPDLTATVEAGLTLNEFNAAARRERQWLPFDGPGAGAASLGAIASCNASGALRWGYGTPRDYVIGLRLAHVDGTQSKSGGRVVKNVAGYDMNKLYVGSFGTLAVLTELTFKLRPLPERAATVLVTAKYRGPLFLLAKRLLASELLPASIWLTNRLRPEIAAPPGGDNALLIRFLDNEAAVNHQLEWIRRAADAHCTVATLDEQESAALWMRVTNVQEQAKNTLRISVPLAQVAAKYEEILLAHSGCVATADVGAGMIRMAFDAEGNAAIKLIKRLRSKEVGGSGSVIIEQAASVVRLQADAWGEVGATARLMQAIKAQFDPQSILNPGRFVAGI